MMLSSSKPLPRPAQRGCGVQRAVRRPARPCSGACNASPAFKTVGVEEGKRMLDMDGYRFLDVRPARDYDAEHITRPARCALNVPLQEGSCEVQFVESVQQQARPATKMLVACADGGSWSRRAMELLAAAGFSQAVLVEGGYKAWRQVFSTGGRRRPAGGGRWMPTGTEALKSGLPIPGVADKYEDVNPV